MKAIIDALLEISLYAAAVAAAIFLFRLLFQKSISPRLQYLVWLLLIARLLLPITLESGFHVESLFPRPVEMPAPVETTAPATVPASPIQAPSESAAEPPPAASVGTGEPQKPRLRVDPYALAGVVWALGTAAFSVWLLAVKLRFFRRMRAVRVKTPPEAEALYARCRAEAGARRGMELWVVDAALSPGIALFRRPVLLVPASMAADREALRFAFLHESMHQRRGDHRMMALLNLLRAVYWFHPAVHVAFSQMLSDMEIACDHDVTRLLEPTEKKAYLTAILDLFSAQAAPQLGMAQFRTRRMARRRMKGAFMKHKATWKASLAAAAMCLVLIVACFTTACQSAPAEVQETPESETRPPNTVSPAPQPTVVNAPPDNNTYENKAARGSFTIENYGGEAQKSNMEHAAELLNERGGTVLQPGEEWSFLSFFNISDDGWNRSPGIADGRYVEGGEPAGLCAVSTAVYNAVLNAELEVTERSHHAWWQVYVAPGLDASVSEGVDFKFKNNTSAPIVLTSSLGETGKLVRLTFTVTVYGAPLENGVLHSLRSQTVATAKAGETVYQDDPSLPVGMTEYAVESRDGMRAEVYRDTYENGVLTQSELLYTDTYEAVAGVIRRGVKTPHPIHEMSDAELDALAKVLYENYRYLSAEHSFEGVNAHYERLLKALEIDFGGLAYGGGVSLNTGVPMAEFKLEACWPYAAVLFALDRDLGLLEIGSMEYKGLNYPETALSALYREDVEAYYGSALKQPLLDYAASEAGLIELLKITARFG